MEGISAAFEKAKGDGDNAREEVVVLSCGADRSGPQEQANGNDNEEGTIGSSPGEAEKEEVAAANPPAGVMEGENGGPGHDDRDKGKSPSYGNMFELVIYCPWTKQ